MTQPLKMLTSRSSSAWANSNGEYYPARYEYLYAYDKVGNREDMTIFRRGTALTSEKWDLIYNGLNQMTERCRYLTDGSSTLQEKWLHAYDTDGNETSREKQNGAGVKQEKLVFSWNPKGQMKLAEKFTGTSDTYAGKVAYRYCLSCDSSLSERIEYSPSSQTTITSWRRYEYDGLNLLRMDEKYDTAGGAIDANDPWRKKEVGSHKPGSLGNMLGKTVYNYTGNTDTPSSSIFYAYYYDAVGNVVWIESAGGNLQYTFTQDAFGNELTTSPFNGTPWSTARTAGITEHQTGKWIDPFTGLYYFHVRWYDSGVGRFISRDPVPQVGVTPYSITGANPVCLSDASGKCAFCQVRDLPGSRPLPPNPIPPAINKKGISPILPPGDAGTICSLAPPATGDSGICNIYPADYEYLTFNAKCVCENALDTAWGMQVRGCLACMYIMGVPAEEAHTECYRQADEASGSGISDRLYIFFRLECLCTNEPHIFENIQR